MTVTLDERVGYLLLGVLIGFVLGYFTHHIRNIEKSVKNVEDVICKTNRNEGGFMRIPRWNELTGRLPFRFPSWQRVALFLVVVMTLWASIQSQIVSNDQQRVSDQQKVAADRDRQTQESISKVTFCNQQILSKTIAALNERTTYTKRQTEANITLQTSFLEFLKVIAFKPPKPQSERTAAFDGYVVKLNNFVELANKSKDKAIKNPYQTIH